MKNKLSTVSSLILLAVFAICSVMVLVSGADIYSGIQARDERASDTRTAQAYITARIRSYDAENGIELVPDETGTYTSLMLHETFNGRDFVTWLYVRDGKLCELFMPADAGLGQEDGDPVLPLDHILFTPDSGTIRVSIPEREFTVRPRTGLTERKSTP